MINALHLLWIIPVAMFFGFAGAAVLSAAKVGDSESERRTWEE